jgi:hypothetical protein
MIEFSIIRLRWGSVMVVVVDELVQKLPKMALAQHHDVVETFLAYVSS